MRTNQTRWILAACFAVALAGVGCGDDGGDEPIAGSGGTGGSTSGTGGGGTGGTTAGRGGGGGASGGPSMAMCVTATVAKIGAQGMACANCVCMKNAQLATACANTSECWDLIRCAGANNCAPGGMTNVACLMANCGMLIDDPASTNAATPFGSPIVRMMCSAECPSMPAGDGGAADAGI